MVRILARACAVIALAISPLTGAFAQTDEDPVATAFAAADANGDGGVNVDEFVAYFIVTFRSVDSDGDGNLRIGDLTNVDPGEFAAADRDADGGVSLDEAIAERMIVFFEADADEDGVLTLDEIRAYRQM